MEVRIRNEHRKLHVSLSSEVGMDKRMGLHVERLMMKSMSGADIHHPSSVLPLDLRPQPSGRNLQLLRLRH